MMNATFGLVEETYILGSASRISYGIAAFADIKNNGTAIIVEAVRDICNDREKIAALVRRCNDLHLSTVHLHDVVEDFLAEPTCEK